jgi:hypothetical protein
LHCAVTSFDALEVAVKDENFPPDLAEDFRRRPGSLTGRTRWRRQNATQRKVINRRNLARLLSRS